MLRNLTTGFGEAEFNLARLAAAAAPLVDLAKPFSGATVDASLLNASGFIDVTFRTVVGQTLNVNTINGNEIRIMQTGGAANVGSITSVERISASTWRYYIAPRTPTPVVGASTAPAPSGPAANTRSNAAFGVGDVTVQFLAGTWSYQNTDNQTVLFGADHGLAVTDQTNTTNVDTLTAVYSSVFTVANIPESQTTGPSFNIGPVKIESPSIGLDKLAFKDKRLVLTIALGADRAALVFGGASQGTSGSGQTNTGGTSVVISGLLVKFDMSVDVLAAVSPIRLRVPDRSLSRSRV